MDDTERLTRISQDVEEKLIPNHKQFFRHFLIHEKDFLKILHLSIRSLKQKKEPAEERKEQTTEEQDSQQSGAGTLYNNSDILEKEKKLLKTTLGTLRSDPDKMDSDKGLLSKKIKKIINNNNLSANTKTELIHDLIATLHKRRILAIERERLPSRNSTLLGAGSTNVNGDAAVDAAGHQSVNAAHPSTIAGSSNDINHNDNIDDSDDDDNDDDDDDDNDEDNDDVNHNDNNANADAIDNRKNTTTTVVPPTPQRGDCGDLLTFTTDSVRDICRLRKLGVSRANLELMNGTSRTIRNYLTVKLKNGVESVDRRFTLDSSGTVTFHDYDGDAAMSLQKLLVSLCFSKSSLFNFLEATSKRKNGAVTPYSNGEKRLLSSFVRLASMNAALIPCLKIRALCT